LSYNPVRILGLVGLSGMVVAGIIAFGLVITRLRGVTTLDAVGVAALYLAMLSAVVGFSLFSLGATFNYLVSLFYKEPIRQGLFGKPIFKTSIESHFGWLGAVSIGLGLVIGFASLILGLNGWEITRLWLYLLGSAMFILLGSQLWISWILIQVLSELSQREILAANEWVVAVAD
jgi:hypothetical protein